MALTLIRPSAHRVMPWKNGGGSTAEIAIHPPGASVVQGFDWRLSIATVAGDGPFSAFPRHDRVIILLSGAGMALRFDDGESVGLDRPFQPRSFAGDRAASCHLIGGPCQDLNLMIARGIAHSTAVLDGAEWTWGEVGATRILFMLRGDAACRGTAAPGRPPSPLALRPRDTLIVAPGEPPPEIRTEPGSLGFAIDIGAGAGLATGTP